jgi:hypothetical protein
MPLSKRFISLGDLYVAYRKAKVEAYYENTHFQALAFTEYEQNLHRNLTRLHHTLLDATSSWALDLSFIGGHSYLPKSIDCSGWDDNADGHFRMLDPISDWSRRFEKSKKRAVASLRLIILPTVDFQVTSALWIIKVGHLFDGRINSALSYANRLRRSHEEVGTSEQGNSAINLTATGLFTPYFSAYREWRENGLSAIERALAANKNILAVTMDIERFYHRVSPKFLLRSSFLASVGLSLSKQELSFTKSLLSAIETWYKSTPDYGVRPDGAVPVGLSASKIIANVLLADFDNAAERGIRPLYYGRYVDDIFLVFENKDQLSGSRQVMQWIAERLARRVVVERGSQGAPSLRVRLPYAKDSELIFRGTKQKIFAFSSSHGKDLIQHIREQIRIQSSEYRLLPAVPSTGAEMAARALLATSDPKLNVDSLRKADAVSVRRLGLSLLLRDIELYSADLQPRSWNGVRNEFYGLVERYAMTPLGFFDFSGYLPRVFGLMLSCRDFEIAEQFISDLAGVAAVLDRTSTLGKAEQKSEFSLCLKHYAEALKQTGLQAATERTLKIDGRFLQVLRSLAVLNPDINIPTSVARLNTLVHQILLADWGRRPYKDYWYLSQRVDEPGPPLPKQLEIRKKLRLVGIRLFKKLSTGLNIPHWPALAFPTRPMRPDEIFLVAPDVLLKPAVYRRLIMVLRGAKVTSHSRLGVEPSVATDGGLTTFVVPGKERDSITLAIASYRTTKEDLRKAAAGRPVRSWTRYSNLNWLVNRILQEQTRPDYIIFPELSIPLRWGLRIARKLAMNNVSLLAGVEYHRERTNEALRNDCLVSLVTSWPGYASNVVRLQPKFLPAYGEMKELRKIKRRLYHPSGILAKPTLYVHKGYCFSVLICSDLTNISHRHELRGQIDTLFVLEWNKDIKTFSSLVEATSTDLHAFVAQVNNRLYGDSRVRAPATADYLRDVVQVKGGSSDFYVLGTVDYLALRGEQRGSTASPRFKPLPIGFKMSGRRRNGKP